MKTLFKIFVCIFMSFSLIGCSKDEDETLSTVVGKVYYDDLLEDWIVYGEFSGYLPPRDKELFNCMGVFKIGDLPSPYSIEGLLLENSERTFIGTLTYEGPISFETVSYYVYRFDIMEIK